VCTYQPSSVPSHIVLLKASCVQLPDKVMVSGELWVKSDGGGLFTSISEIT
jgi:hypothetical protein